MLTDTAIATSHLKLHPDSDNVTRRVDLTLNNIPTLGVAAVQAYSLENRLVSIPSDIKRMRIHWPGPANSLASLSLIDVLNGEFSPGYLQNKIALVGYDSTANNAQIRTPFDDQIPVVSDYMHATIIHNLLQRNWLRSPPISSVILLLLIGGCHLERTALSTPCLGQSRDDLWAKC